MKVSAAPKVSIITCFYNVGELLQEAIESVLLQKYKYWELWLIDDGSSDSSTQIAKSYADTYPNQIIYCEHEQHQNRGASASRNVGIARASGELIAFLDGDDVWLPDLLLNLVNLMYQYPVAMVCEATEYWYNWQDDTKQNKRVLIGTKQDCVHLPPDLLLDLYPLGKGAAPCICGMLVKKSILQKYGGFESDFTGMYDDQALLIKLYLNEVIFISSGCHNLYRQRKGSLVESSHSGGRYHHERKQFLEWLAQYCQNNQINSPKVRRALAQALYPYRHAFRYSIKQNILLRGVRFFRKMLQSI